MRTDHKPLVYIFNESKSIPAMAYGRVQRWALTLGAYQYTIKFQKGTENTIADAVSQLPLLETRTELPKPAEVVYVMEYLDTSPVMSAQICRWTEDNAGEDQTMDPIQMAPRNMRPYAPFSTESVS